MEKVPIFLNSANYDINFQKNTEYNNFVLVDRYMLNRERWKTTLREVKSYKGKWQDKKNVMYWRGMHTSLNQTDFDQYDYAVTELDVPCEFMILEKYKILLLDD